jgi:predicted lipoprotein with Yx(FWY)xxD motif
VKRILVLLIAAAAFAVPAAGVARSSHRATVKLANTDMGKLLVDAEPGATSGFTLYMFTRDGRNKDNCIKNPNCKSIWPPLTVSGKPTAGPGVRAALLGTIAIGHGQRQVTYAGHPLYIYSQDFAPAQTSYIGQVQFGGTWYGINAAGKAVK